MRITLVSTSDLQGGANVMAFRTLQGLLTNGIKANLFVRRKLSSHNNVQELKDPVQKIFELLIDGTYKFPGSYKTGKLLRKYHAQFYSYLKRSGREVFYFPASHKLLNKKFAPDVVHLHNVHGDYFDLRIIDQLSKNSKLVITMHDTWLLSGHCALPFDCNRWETGCGNCPDLTIYPAVKKDKTAENWLVKKDIFSKSEINLIAPSEWILDRAKRSMLWPSVKNARVIHNFIDTDIFKITKDNTSIREELKLPLNKKIVLFAANNITKNIWKDYTAMAGAVEILSKEVDNVLFLALGEENKQENKNIQFIPYIKDPILLAKYYQAADIYLHAAKQEIWGLTISEAMACGTPVVATAVGGIPEQVHGYSGFGEERVNKYSLKDANGLLTSPSDKNRLAEAMKFLLQNDNIRKTLGTNGARYATTELNKERNMQELIEFYKEIISS